MQCIIPTKTSLYQPRPYKTEQQPSKIFQGGKIDQSAAGVEWSGNTERYLPFQLVKGSGERRSPPVGSAENKVGEFLASENTSGRTITAP